MSQNKHVRGVFSTRLLPGVVTLESGFWPYLNALRQNKDWKLWLPLAAIPIALWIIISSLLTFTHLLTSTLLTICLSISVCSLMGLSLWSYLSRLPLILDHIVKLLAPHPSSAFERTMRGLVLLCALGIVAGFIDYLGVPGILIGLIAAHGVLLFAPGMWYKIKTHIQTSFEGEHHAAINLLKGWLTLSAYAGFVAIHVYLSHCLINSWPSTLTWSQWLLAYASLPFGLLLITSMTASWCYYYLHHWRASSEAEALKDAQHFKAVMVFRLAMATLLAGSLLATELPTVIVLSLSWGALCLSFVGQTLTLALNVADDLPTQHLIPTSEIKYRKLSDPPAIIDFEPAISPAPEQKKPGTRPGLNCLIL